MFYLSQKEKYPNGRKKTEAEKFLNYRLGIPERKTAPWFEETPTYIPESPSEHLDRVFDVTSKIVKGIGRQTKKTTSKGEPYVPHVKFALGGDKGDSFSGAGAGGSWEDTKDTYPEVKDFNEAFDKAVKAGLPEFLFQGRRYNTKKEHNPVREYNNRWVGAGRRSDVKNPSKAYDHQAGPIGGSLSLIPVVTDTYIGSPNRPNQLDYNPNAVDRVYSFGHYYDKPKKISPKKSYGGPLFALGGDIQTNGSDFTTGMTHISAGGSHEENPYEGIQVGIDSEGTPNLVEEGETIYNDYVYSNRILADEATKQKFRLPKKRDITFADISKRLEKEAAERPNDPISQAALRVQMQDLADEQERQKQEMEAQRAREAFEALSPEEQTALMQQAAQQEQMAQQQAMQEQAATEQQQPSPEEMAMAEQQQMMQADGSEAMVGQEPQINAYGGKVNKFAGTQPGSNQMRNAGTWKAGNTSSNWNTYTRGGLRDYLENVVKRIQMAPDDETANNIRQEAINTVANIQQAYAKAYQNELTPVSEREDVGTLQSAFQNAGGNKYFGSIADNINLPFGHNTTDTEAGGWVDKLWGPRTSIRNWGSTEYGDADYYKDIADLATQAGLVYSPNTDWTYGDNYQLYGLSLLNPTTASETPASDTGIPDRWKWENIDSNTAADGNPNMPNEADKTKGNGTADNEWEVTPNYRNDKLRYAGLFGPAVGLGMQALGIGRPNTKGLEGVLDAYDKQGAATADYQPIGNYLRYRPMDIWYEQNRMDANARATDKALQNNASPIGNRMAGLLASGYNSQTADGQLYRQALEYNDALRKQTADFNRGTDMFNAEAYNRAALQNAEVRNRDRQLRANLGMQAAQAKMDADAGWYNGIYGNVAGLFKGIGDLGRENAQHNMIAEMAADGIFGPISPRTNTGRRDGYLTFTKKSAAKGGKINKKKG